jgi:Kef-type K+ transport system membrane component KefB
MTLGDHPIFVVLAAAVAAPLLAEMPAGRRVPIVVLEVLLGILVGPHVLGLIQLDAFLSVMRTAGTAAVLFMAGMEIDFERIRGRPLSLALGGWVASLGLAFLTVALLHVIPGVHAPMMVTIALSTTGLGTLLPILRDGGQLETPFGRLLLAAGTVGEVGPIVAVSLALSQRYSSWQEFGFLLAFLALVVLAAAVGTGARPPKVLALLGRTMQTSTQLPVRLALFVIATFVVVAMEFGFEGILGAFAAGMIVGLSTHGPEGEAFRLKIDAVCFGWLTPFFFVGTGIAFDLAGLTRDVTTMLLIPTLLVLFLVVRGAPVLLYRNDLRRPEQLPFGLFVSVASLGLVVVITEIGVRAKHMTPAIAQALMGAALLSLLVYPTLARVLFSKTEGQAQSGRTGGAARRRGQ